MSIRFLNRVIPKENESLYSFLFRTAKANYFDHLTDVISNPRSFYTLNCNQFYGTYQWVDVARSIVGNSTQDINELVCNKFDKPFLRIDEKEDYLMEKDILRTYYLWKFTKYCPSCLNEDFYHRLHWDISFVTSCSVHNKRLVLKCPNCNAHIRMHSIMRNQCKCGYTFSNATSVEVGNPIILKSQSLIQSAILNNSATIQRADGIKLNEKEYLFLFSSFYRLLSSLPTKEFVSDKSRYDFKQFFSKQVNMEKHLENYMDFLIPIIHSLIIEPQKELLALFSTIDDIKASKNGRIIARKKSSVLKEIFDSPCGSIYSVLYSEYNLMHKEDYEYRNLLIKLNHLERSFITMVDAKRLIGRGETFIRNLCKSGLLKYKVIDRRGKKAFLIEKKSVLKWVEHSKSIISTLDVRELLGITHKQYRELVEADFLKFVHGPSVDGFSNYFVEKEGVDNFSLALLSKGKMISAVNDKWITLNSAKSNVKKKEMSFIKMIQLALDNKVRVIFLKSKPLIEGIYFLKKDIQALRLFYFKEYTETIGYTKLELRRIFRTEVNRWLEQGILKVDHVDTRASTAVIHVKRKQVIEKLMELKGYTEDQAIAYLEECNHEFSSF